MIIIPSSAKVNIIKGCIILEGIWSNIYVFFFSQGTINVYPNLKYSNVQGTSGANFCHSNIVWLYSQMLAWFKSENIISREMVTWIQEAMVFWIKEVNLWWSRGKDNKVWEIVCLNLFCINQWHTNTWKVNYKSFHICHI